VPQTTPQGNQATCGYSIYESEDIPVRPRTRQWFVVEFTHVITVHGSGSAESGVGDDEGPTDNNWGVCASVNGLNATPFYVGDRLTDSRPQYRVPLASIGVEPYIAMSGIGMGWQEPGVVGGPSDPLSVVSPLSASTSTTAVTTPSAPARTISSRLSSLASASSER
jgi:hypothetical protein